MQRLAQPAGRAVKLKFGKSVVSPQVAGAALVWPSFVCVWRPAKQHFSPAGISSHVRHRGQLHISLGSGEHKGRQASSRTGRGTTQHHGGRGRQEGNRCGATGSNAHLGRSGSSGAEETWSWVS